jgi:hypothetical protein
MIAAASAQGKAGSQGAKRQAMYSPTHQKGASSS